MTQNKTTGRQSPWAFVTWWRGVYYVRKLVRCALFVFSAASANGKMLCFNLDFLLFQLFYFFFYFFGAFSVEFFFFRFKFFKQS